MSAARGCGWDDLARELDAWGAEGRSATLWWRDDDAGAPGPRLDRLLDIGAQANVCIALAVIPAQAGEALARRLERSEHAYVMQHGWAHRNHAPAQAKKSELGPGRALSAITADLARGRERLAALVGPPAVLVPPWNRLQDDVLAALPGLGLRGVSCYGPRPRDARVVGLSQTNTHVDIIDWRGRRGFAGTALVLAALVSHLRARRAAMVDATEPTGILSHHRVHDEPCWSFLPELLRQTCAHPAAVWVHPAHAVLG